MDSLKGGRLESKVAIVTGGASGIGEATSLLFAQEGAKVILVDIQVDRGLSVVSQIQRSGGTAEFFRCDMAIHAQVKALIEHAASRYGRLDILVNNAAVESPLPEVDTTEEEYDRIMDVNVKGVFLSTKYAVPLMKKNGGGSIINISSAYGIIGSPGFAAYHASKGAVRLLTKSTAVTHARDGIRANSIHPGAVDTPLLREAITTNPDPVLFEKTVAQAQPIGRLGRPEEIASGCLFFASDESKFCIGSELSIDGGMVAQ
jgi:NAD(P)-dependent dehydrogenase (short-subunit alcohol dehydrogenase family)